jgi:phosphonate transport system substrate-binding protein
MFTEVNESDARAAMKVWIQTVAKERGIPVDSDSQIYSTVEAAVAGSRTNQVDGFGLTTPEFEVMSHEIPFGRLATGVRGESTTDSYVLLVRADGGLKNVQGLEKRNLIVLRNPRMSLAMIWLDTVLLQKGLKPAREFVDRATFSSKATQVALPVFFRQADACLMTRRSFEVMTELNPQVGKQLRVLAESPALVPSGFAFRADYHSLSREQIVAEMERLAETPAGRQILTLTQADRIEERPRSCLDSALELIATHRRLSGGKENARADEALLPSGGGQPTGGP